MITIPRGGKFPKRKCSWIFNSTKDNVVYCGAHLDQPKKSLCPVHELAAEKQEAEENGES